MDIAALASLIAQYPPSKTFLAMQQAEQEGNFDKACALAAHQFTVTANQVRRECQAAGQPHEAAFWQKCAGEAKAARAVCRDFAAQPLRCRVAALRQAGLRLYADALEGEIAWTELIY